MSDAQTSGYRGDDPVAAELHREPITLFPEREPEQPEQQQASVPSRRRLLVLGAAALVGLAGVIGIGSFAWRITAEKDATLETPSQVAGLTRDDSERARNTAEYLRDGFSADIDLDRSVGAIYQDPAAAERSVLLFGGTTLLWQPGRDLDKLFELLSDETGKVTDLHEVPPGSLGGVMKCGVTVTEDGTLTVCGWADHGSVVLAMFPGRSADESGRLLRDIREEIQTRS